MVIETYGAQVEEEIEKKMKKLERKPMETDETFLLRLQNTLGEKRAQIEKLQEELKKVNEKEEIKRRKYFIEETQLEVFGIESQIKELEQESTYEHKIAA